MERDEFLKSLGLGLALVCTGSCFQACSKGGDDDDSTPSGASVDISTLASIGSSKTVSGIIFFRIAASNDLSSFIATQSKCPHEGLEQLSYNQSQNRIICSAHGSAFTTSGSLANGPATSGLKKYTLSLSGTTLTAIS